MASEWTDAQREALRAAIASGVLTVSFGGRSVTYQSLREMRNLLAEMDRQLASSRTYRLAATSKGV